MHHAFALRCLCVKQMSRIEALQGFLQDDPSDSFSRYALALEFAKIDRHVDAVREFSDVIRRDPNYVAAYYQLGQLFATLGRREEAGATFRNGIDVAARIKDDHTRSELEAALAAL